MPDGNVTTYCETLYDKARRELKWNIAFAIIASAVLFLLALVIFLNRFVLIKVYVSGSSMYPTLKSGDIVVLNTRAEPEYGDIIVIKDEKENGDWLIKRAIAFGGDTIQIKDGSVFLKKSGETDFNKLEENYLAESVKTIWNDARANGFTIPDGEIFYLGDNRVVSSDSRSTYGTCQQKQIVGVVSDLAVKIKGITTFLNNLSLSINKI